MCVCVFFFNFIKFENLAMQEKSTTTLTHNKCKRWGPIRVCNSSINKMRGTYEHRAQNIVNPCVDATELTRLGPAADTYIIASSPSGDTTHPT